ncbi:MAG: hypothetical protein AB1610_08955 [Nitrospirota bacterium]
MRLEELEEGSPLRVFGEEIWDFIEELLGVTIDQPRGESEYHLVRRGDRHFLSFRFVGPMARVFPQHSLILYAPWGESFHNIPEIRRGERTWHNGPSAELGVQPEQGEIARQFIHLAYDQVHGL